jgi:hypothetical protein
VEFKGKPLGIEKESLRVRPDEAQNRPEYRRTKTVEPPSEASLCQEFLMSFDSLARVTLQSSPASVAALRIQVVLSKPLESRRLAELDAPLLIRQGDRRERRVSLAPWSSRGDPPARFTVGTAPAR